MRATYTCWSRPAAEESWSAKCRSDAELAKLDVSPVLTGEDRRKAVGDALLLSLFPESAELSTRFEISLWN